MTVKEFLRTAPSDVAASAIHNIARTWLESMYPGIEITPQSAFAFLQAATEYLDMEAKEQTIKSAEELAEIFRKALTEMRKSEGV